MRTVRQGFTIVELLIVIIVIAILATITITAYNGVTTRAKEGVIKTELEQAFKKIESFKVLDAANVYPTSYTQAGLTQPANTTYSYSGGGAAFCLQATNGSLTYYISELVTTPRSGECPVAAVAMQTVTNASCTTTRTLVFDARDSRSYWIQKLADGRCWMLTNLAYAGGGSTTYSDTKSLTNRTGSGTDNSIAGYYVPPSANVTTTPAQASLSSDGGATGAQYGYLYNWCAAKGSQLATAACMNATSPVPTAATVCPSNWRLPTGGTSGELTALNTAVNGASTTSSAGLLSNWLMQYSGYLGAPGAFYNQGSVAMYWSSTQVSASNAHYLSSTSSETLPNSSAGKQEALAVRCVAS